MITSTSMNVNTRITSMKSICVSIWTTALMWKKIPVKLLSPKDIKLNFLSTALPRWLSGNEFACQCRRHGFEPWVGKILLEKEITTHSSMLAWEIPCLEGSGGKYMGLQRAGHDLATFEKTTTFLLIKEFRIKNNKADPRFFFFFSTIVKSQSPVLGDPKRQATPGFYCSIS